jgi:hypothetical protein
MKTLCKVIEIIVGTNGSTRVETQGFRGTECQQASRFLEITLGQRIDETLTAEFHDVSCVENRAKESS